MFLTFNPGPSQISQATIKDIGEAIDRSILSISHRSEQFKDIFRLAVENLRRYLCISESYKILFVSSATEAMEIVLRNCAGRSSFHFVNGAFSERFYKIAEMIGKDPVKLVAEYGKGFDLSEVNIPDQCDLICITHNETSTGYRWDYQEIQEVRSKYPGKIISVDIVSSALSEPLPVEEADIWFFSVQKVCGLPAGLGVIILNEKVISKSRELVERGSDIGSFHSLPVLYEKAEKYQTFETPNILNIFLFYKAMGRLCKIGIDEIEKKTREKAHIIYSWLEAHEHLRPFIEDPEHRSLTVVTVFLPEWIKCGVLAEKLGEMNIVIGRGYGDFSDSQFRIANFIAHSRKDVMVLIKSVDEVLERIGK